MNEYKYEPLSNLVMNILWQIWSCLIALGGMLAATALFWIYPDHPWTLVFCQKLACYGVYLAGATYFLCRFRLEKLDFTKANKN